MAKKIKSNSSLLDELDKALYEGRWKDIELALKKTKKKHEVPESFSLFLLGVELTEIHLLGPQAQSTIAASVHPDKVLGEAEEKLMRCISLCQPGHDASLHQLAKIKLGQLKWLNGDYKSSLVALMEVQNTADISLLYICKVILEGNLYMGLCFELLASDNPSTDKFQAINAYEVSLRHALTLVHLAKDLSMQQHPAAFKAIKTVLERATILSLQMKSPIRALTMLRRVLQSKEDDVLREARMACTTCLSSLLLFHFCPASYAPPSVTSHSVSFTPSHLREELNLVTLLSKAATDSWNPSRVNPNPSPATTFDLLTLSLSDSKLPAQVVQVLESGMRFACDLPHIWYQFALALVSNGQNEQALAVFKECISLSPNDPLILCTAAKFSLEKANQPELCLKWAQVASKHTSTHFLKPRVEFLLGRGFTVLAEQERSSQKRGELHKEGLEHLSAAASLDNQNVEYAFHHALQEAEARDLVSAVTEVKRALSLNSGHTSCLHLLTLILSAQKHYVEALKVCSFALQKQPENFGLLECKTKLEVITVSIHQALKTCKHALQLWQHLFSKENTGLIKIVTQDHQSLSDIPLTTFERSDKHKDFSDDLASDTGSSHFSLGAAQMPTNQPNLLQARIWCTIADVFLNAGKVSDACSCVREAQYLGPYLSSVLTTHGRVLEQEGKTEEAMKLYRNVLSLQPGNPTALTLVGRLLHHGGRNIEAEKYLREATSVDQLSHEAWYWLGEVFSSQDQHELSADCFKTSLELETTTPIQPFSAVLSSFIPSSS
jgi:tetratricopeptide (TPR) repeat protein